MKKIFRNSADYYKESFRYLRNARENLKKAKISNDRYQDLKPVQEACGIAYLAVLKAIDGYLIQRGLDFDKLPTSTEGYWKNLKKILVHNGKITDAFSIVYENLHIFGYYRGASSVKTVKEGFEKAKMIVDTLSKNKM